MLYTSCRLRNKVVVVDDRSYNMNANNSLGVNQIQALFLSALRVPLGGWQRPKAACARFRCASYSEFTSIELLGPHFFPLFCLAYTCMPIEMVFEGVGFHQDLGLTFGCNNRQVFESYAKF